ncbi:fumarate hydratase [Acetonema longum]|nr:fumarate hydratase [Acetonema longum]
MSVHEIIDKVADTLVRASTTFSPDQERAYRSALARETNPNARWVLEALIENAEQAKTIRSPLCDDTGIPHVVVELGAEAQMPKGFLPAVEQGIAEGLRRLPGRPMGVKGNDIERITQSAGLYPDSDGVVMAPVQLKNVPGDKIKLTVIMMGGGPELRGKTLRVFHKHSFDVVKNEMIDWAKDAVAKLGCQPVTLAFGIGRTNLEAASLALDAMKDGSYDVQSEFEQAITDAVNGTDVGPLGLGGNTSVLGTFIKVGPHRASGFRVISLRTGCCVDPRRASATF